jgi:hypothetical protein
MQAPVVLRQGVLLCGTHDTLAAADHLPFPLLLLLLQAWRGVMKYTAV